MGSLPPDANRPVSPNIPVGESGRYAERLILGQAVRAPGVFGVTNFLVGPVAIEANQTLELDVFMFPKVYFSKKRVKADELDRFLSGLFVGLLLNFAGGGLVGQVIGDILGAIFGEDEQEVDAPCFNTIITARHRFSASDLDRIESNPGQMERFGPRDNEASAACDPIDSFYYLSVNITPPTFGVTPPPEQVPSELIPWSGLDAVDFLRGSWGDVGDDVTDCLVVEIRFQDGNLANVIVREGPAGTTRRVRPFNSVPLQRLVVIPDFVRNVYADTDCPARSVKPVCRGCSKFANLSAAQGIPPRAVFI